MFALFAGAAHSHPLGNFTVNHFSRLKIGEGKLRVTYIIDMAEIPAFEELRTADTDGDGNTSQTELDLYVKRATDFYRSGVRLSIDGKPEQLSVDAAKIAALPGAGGLKTLRLEYELIGSLPDREPGLPHRVQYQDTNQPDRIGWREIVVQPGPNITIFDSSAFSNSISNELRTYPADMLASPLTESRAELSWTVGPAPAGAVLLRTRDGRSTVAALDRFAELIAVHQLTPRIVLLGLLLAAFLGAAHALSPGHGKTVVGAYLVGSRGTPRHAAFLGLTVTVTHTAGVFALGLLTLFASRYVLPERLFPVLSLISGALVALIGLTLFTRRLGAAWTGTREHTHTEHDQDFGSHVHSHDGGELHSHLPPGADGQAISWRNLLALGISGGLLPCPSALVVLLSAVALHRVGYGLLLVVAFGVGLAATLTGIGLAFVYAGRWLGQFGSSARAEWLRWVAPVLSALVVACLGVVICYGALVQIGADPIVLAHEGLRRWHAIVSGEETLARLGTSAGAWAVVIFGLILGFKHVTEADHVVAVSSIVSEHREIAKVALVGGLWGLGHTLTLVSVGVVVLLLGIAIPERISQYLEFAVGLMIIGLSGTALSRVLRRRGDLHVHIHAHGAGEHSHIHFHEQGTEHLGSSANHSHRVSRIGWKPLLVGAMHGLAGSAALTLLVLTQVHSVFLGLSYLVIFGFGSVFGMMMVSTLIGVPFALSARNLAKATAGLQVVAGCVGLCFGCWYAFSVGTSAFR
ncbi:MAG: sulfite exporter TauE/SafE family protein [Bryobacterales bacterium]|nr:sulfite exporter TauE/SafE family protein [Bryobacterales bacterium]